MGQERRFDDVRFTPNIDRAADIPAWQKSANSDQNALQQ
jgi:hypothetical protein